MNILMECLSFQRCLSISPSYNRFWNVLTGAKCSHESTVSSVFVDGRFVGEPVLHTASTTARRAHCCSIFLLAAGAASLTDLLLGAQTRQPLLSWLETLVNVYGSIRHISTFLYGLNWLDHRWRRFAHEWWWRSWTKGWRKDCGRRVYTFRPLLPRPHAGNPLTLSASQEPDEWHGRKFRTDRVSLLVVFSNTVKLLTYFTCSILINKQKNSSSLHWIKDEPIPIILVTFYWSSAHQPSLFVNCADNNTLSKEGVWALIRGINPEGTAIITARRDQRVQMYCTWRQREKGEGDPTGSLFSWIGIWLTQQLHKGFAKDLWGLELLIVLSLNAVERFLVLQRRLLQ